MKKQILNEIIDVLVELYIKEADAGGLDLGSDKLDGDPKTNDKDSGLDLGTDKNKISGTGDFGKDLGVDDTDKDLTKSDSGLDDLDLGDSKSSGSSSFKGFGGSSSSKSSSSSDDIDSDLEPGEADEDENKKFNLDKFEQQALEDPSQAIVDMAKEMTSKTNNTQEILNVVKGSLQRHFNNLNDAMDIIDKLYGTNNKNLMIVARKLLMFIDGE